uniref:Uncharacterized protein n=1 Tax=Chromera velia CCMP2878 TaxID=1169474 RepID=A0A0G4G0P5_9ALVE|eukprot:Cvel_19695.t1-p1 / transcript=Cvel_19695.t1 / gene=Cvel_19695 / organism=Chromera_velia_CCMP2878 / gene_product=hypothetical protein / transcript_product=hypothetical protein / location=Cvel_scaffold1718:18985-20724(+) / protein_length=580 / sequence_SO=supercontig / SO=protein_coding / is_pseudo=false
MSRISRIPRSKTLGASLGSLFLSNKIDPAVSPKPQPSIGAKSERSGSPSVEQVLNECVRRPRSKSIVMPRGHTVRGSVEVSPAVSQRPPSIALRSPSVLFMNFAEEEDFDGGGQDDDISLYGLMKARKREKEEGEQNQKDAPMEDCPSPSSAFFFSPSSSPLDESVSLYGLMRQRALSRKVESSLKGEEDRPLRDLYASCPPEHTSPERETDYQDGDVSLEEMIQLVATKKRSRENQVKEGQERKCHSFLGGKNESISAAAVPLKEVPEAEMRSEESLHGGVNNPSAPHKPSMHKHLSTQQPTHTPCGSTRKKPLTSPGGSGDDDVSLTDLMAERKKGREAKERERNGQTKKQLVDRQAAREKEFDEHEEAKDEYQAIEKMRKEKKSLFEIIAQMAKTENERNEKSTGEGTAAVIHRCSESVTVPRRRRQTFHFTIPNQTRSEIPGDSRGDDPEKMRAETRSRSVAFPSSDVQRDMTDEIAIARMRSRSPSIRSLKREAQRRKSIPGILSVSTSVGAPSSSVPATRSPETQQQQNKGPQRGQLMPSGCTEKFRLRSRQWVRNEWRHSRLTNFFADEEDEE